MNEETRYLSQSLQQEHSTCTNISTLEVGHVIAHKQRLLKVIGSGSFSDVCKVEDIESHKLYAMKIQQKTQNSEIDSSFVNQSNEVDIQALVQEYFERKQPKSLPSSKNFIQFQNHFETSINGSQQQVILMDQLDIDLKSNQIQKNIRIDMQTVLKIVQKLSVCLFILKKCNVIHLDIKSENILIKKHLLDDKKVQDFYLSDFGHSITQDKSKTVLQACSLNYRAPEILLTHEFDYKVDIQSLGVLLVEMLLGGNPFRCSSIGEALYSHTLIYGDFSNEFIEKSSHFDVTKQQEFDEIENKYKLKNKDKQKNRKHLDSKQSLDYYLKIIKIRQDDEIVNFSKIEKLILGMTARNPSDRMKHIEIEKLIVSTLNEIYQSQQTKNN